MAANNVVCSTGPWFDVLAGGSCAFGPQVASTLCHPVPPCATLSRRELKLPANSGFGMTRSPTGLSSRRQCGSPLAQSARFRISGFQRSLWFLSSVGEAQRHSLNSTHPAVPLRRLADLFIFAHVIALVVDVFELHG